MRIAFVSMHTSPASQPGSGDAGGMNVVERGQADALAQRGHSVELITRRNSPNDPEIVELAENVFLRHLDAGPQAPLPKSTIDQHIAQFSDGFAQLGSYDLVHSHHWMSGMAALPVARHWGVPHLQSFHSVAALPGAGLREGEPAESAARVPGEAKVAQESDAVVAISAAEAHTVVDRCGADPRKVHIVSPGVDHGLFSPEATGLEPQADYVLFAARLQPLKGPDLAIKTMAQLPSQLRPTLIVAGDTSVDFAGYADSLQSLVTELGLQGQVEFVGPQNRAELANLMRGAKVVLVPSYSETFGLVALEAESCGTPVIAAASGGLREAVAHGETGQLMDSRQPEDWGRALLWMLCDGPRLAMMGTVAQIHARRFDWHHTAARLESIYSQLCSELARSL